MCLGMWEVEYRGENGKRARGENYLQAEEEQFPTVPENVVHCVIENGGPLKE